MLYQQGAFTFALACGHWLSVGQAISLRCQLIEWYISLNLDFIPSISSAQNKVWWTYHWFGVYCYFFISLLRDIFLYAPALWNYYNSHSEPALNKSLAKAIPASEHNLAQNKTNLLRLQFTLKVGWGLQEDRISLLFWVDRAKESTERAPDENEHLPGAGCGSGRFLEQPVGFSREAAFTEGQESLSYEGWRLGRSTGCPGWGSGGWTGHSEKVWAHLKLCLKVMMLLSSRTWGDSDTHYHHRHWTFHQLQWEKGNIGRFQTIDLLKSNYLWGWFYRNLNLWWFQAGFTGLHWENWLILLWNW